MTSTKKFKYTGLVQDMNESPVGMTIFNEMNRLGEEGWELVETSYQYYKFGMVIYIFKKEIY